MDIVWLVMVIRRIPSTGIMLTMYIGRPPWQPFWRLPPVELRPAILNRNPGEPAENPQKQGW